MKILETERLVLRHITLEDAPFMLELLNEPAFHRFIGDRGVRTVEATRAYLQSSYLAGYERDGFSMFLAVRRSDSAPIGICGLIKRDGLDDVDIGFAFRAEYCSQGYGYEAAAATLAWGSETLGLERIVAITAPANTSSIALLEKLGMSFERQMKLAGETEVKLFAWHAP